MQTISVATGRGLLMTVVLSNFLLSVGLVFYVGGGGAVHREGIMLALEELLEIYLPLLAIMGAFYFADYRSDEDSPRASLVQPFIFSLIIVSVWAFAPPLLLALTVWPIEDIFSFLNSDAVGILGKTIAAGAVTYYFSRFG